MLCSPDWSGRQLLDLLSSLYSLLNDALAGLAKAPSSEGQRATPAQSYHIALDAAPQCHGRLPLVSDPLAQSRGSLWERESSPADA